MDPITPSYRRRVQTFGITLHASHTPPSKAGIVPWLQVNGRRLGLLTIGYHFVILRDGELIETRPHECQGSHARGLNERWIGVVLAGGVDEAGEPADNFTLEQKETLHSLFWWLEGVYGKPFDLLGHYEQQSMNWRTQTSPRCPPCDVELLRIFIYQGRNAFNQRTFSP